MQWSLNDFKWTSFIVLVITQEMCKQIDVKEKWMRAIRQYLLDAEWCRVQKKTHYNGFWMR